MLRRIAVFILLATLAFTVACTNKKVNNPLANVGSKQPDKVLFDRAMDAMKHNRFDVARITLQTLINTYPDSEYIARAKLAVADSWYAEGGSTSLAQAEAEYKDFETFFPNMPEAAEAQVKIANIHYQQMEKPDRDFTHAMRAEEEYRQVILQYPDNKKMVAEAKQRLLEVQEVIAEREYRVGRFYYLRESYPAAIARLQSLAIFFFSSRRRHTRFDCDWSSDVCSSDLQERHVSFRAGDRLWDENGRRHLSWQRWHDPSRAAGVRNGRRGQGQDRLRRQRDLRDRKSVV